MVMTHERWIQQAWDYRFALKHLLLKDFRIRYRNMSLGVAWSILNPLVMLGILLALFSFIYPQRGIPNFSIFLLAGLVCYNLVNLAVPPATSCILDNASIVKKIVFPRFMLPVSVVLSQSLHVLIQLLIIFCFTAALGVSVTAYWLWIPIALFVELIFVLGLAMIASALNVYFRDVRYVVENSLAILFWLSPVFYPLTAVTEQSRWWIGLIYQLNPLAGCIDAMRKAILYASHPDPLAFGLATAVALIFLGVGLMVFNRMESVFSDLI